jgi:hypothetical protein
MKMNVWVAALLLAVIHSPKGNCQQSTDSLPQVSRASSLVFVERDGTCLDAVISKIDATEITVQPYGKSPITIQRSNLVQISQGDALLFTTLNSWVNVEEAAAHVYPREAFVLRLKKGKLIKGRPTKVTSDRISLKHGLANSDYLKDDVATVDYLRLKPESDAFDYFSQEAPALLFFDPEFYYRAMGLEGRIPVRLYDGTKPVTDAAPKCSRR